MLPTSLLAISALCLAPATVALVTLPSGHQFLGRPHRDSLTHSNVPFARRSLHGVTGRQKRATYATVRCDSLYKWSLCDADNCTDMGSVAPGTACIDGAMTFDPISSQGAAAPSTDSGSLAGSAEEKSSASSGSSQDSSGSDSAVAVAPVVINAAVQKQSATSTSRRRKNRKITTSKPKATAAVAHKQATDAPTVIAAAVQASPSSTSAVNNVASIVSDLITGGFATFFNQEGGIGACGQAHQDSDFIVALALARYGTGSNNAPDCGRKLTITNTANGKTVQAAVADACPGCRNFNSLDLSVATFNAIADPATGVVPISWKFLD